MDDLLDAAKSDSDHGLHRIALEGFLRMIALDAGERSPEETRKLYEDAMELARHPDDRVTVLSGLPRVNDFWALEFLKPYLEISVTRQAAEEARQRLHSSLARKVSHDACGCSVALAHSFREKYSGGHKDALTDGKWGSTQYGDGRWQGFKGMDLDAVIDLGKTVEIRCIRAGFLQDVRSWIFLPDEIHFYLSRDGDSFEEIDVVNVPVLEEMKEASLEDFYIDTEGRPARFVRVKALNVGTCPEWHPGNGAEAWLFADEIQVNPHLDASL
jgi:hypothetical protein